MPTLLYSSSSPSLVSQKIEKEKKILASPFTDPSDKAAFGFGYYKILRVTFIEPFDAFCMFTHLSADSWRKAVISVEPFSGFGPHWIS